MGPDLELWEGCLRLLIVVVLAGAIGLERELRDQEAGLRTHMLVGLGAALFIIVGVYSWAELDFGNQVGIVLDPSRVVAYVVTGIGFLVLTLGGALGVVTVPSRSKAQHVGKASAAT